jgi:hypothetical protein
MVALGLAYHTDVIFSAVSVCVEWKVVHMAGRELQTYMFTNISISKAAT